MKEAIKHKDVAISRLNRVVESRVTEEPEDTAHLINFNNNWIYTVISLRPEAKVTVGVAPEGEEGLRGKHLLQLRHLRRRIGVVGPLHGLFLHNFMHGFNYLTVFLFLILNNFPFNLFLLLD